MRVLIVEDDPNLRTALAERFRETGFVVDEAGDGREGLYHALESPIDLAVVDLGLPEMPGLEVIRRLRAAGRRYPVLILTARGRWQEKVEGLEAGADDYLTKPFEPEELLARMRALLRRAGGAADATLRCGPITLDPRSQSVRRDGHELTLTAFEYRLLEYLMHRAGQVVSKTELVEHLYDDADQRDSNTIEVFVARLRRKLAGPDGSAPIETLRARGYRLDDTAEEPRA